MSTTVEEIRDAVLRALEHAGYSSATVADYTVTFGQLAKATGGGEYTTAAGAAFASVTEGPSGAPYAEKTLSKRRRVVRIADEYVATGSIDLRSARGLNPPPMPKSPDLLEALELYAEDNASRGLAAGTCEFYWRLAREFALYVESVGVTSFGEARTAYVLGFVASLRSGRWAGTSAWRIAACFRPFLRFLGRDDMAQALTMTRQPRERRILPVIADADEEALARACTDGTVGARDAAITLLALTTGMRSCDICGLELGDIGWRTLTISVVQRKTGNPLTVPMAPAVAEAIARYVLEDRPESTSPKVFLSSRAPYGPLEGHASIYRITSCAFAAAGVEGGGTLLMRHNAASKMVRAGSDIPVVSAVLGHADTDSSGAYIESDEVRMRGCVLPLPEAVGR